MHFKNLNELIKKNAELYPNKEYIFFHDRTITFKDAEEAVNKTSAVLQSNGVKAGDRVGIFLVNSPEYIFSYFAIVKLGAIAVPCNTFLKEQELANNMNDCQAEYLITSASYEKVVAELPPLVPTMKKIFTYSEASFPHINITTAKAAPLTALHTPELNDTVVLIYTSGTTGKPKGVMLTHQNLLQNAYATSEALAFQHHERVMALLPMFHSYAFMVCCITPFIKGCSIVILESILETGKDSYKTMLQTVKPTFMVGVPQLFSAMSRKKILEEMPFRGYLSGGAPLPVDTIKAFHDTYGVSIVEGYGLSEASPVVSINPLDRQKHGSIGLPLRNVQVKVVDENGQILPAGKRGELCTKGLNVMKGYWNQPLETEKVLKDDNWLHTGDVAEIDEDGFIFIVDRIKDLILVKGMNVYPREIEELLHDHAAINCAAVIGLPDDDGSEVIVAYVKLQPEHSITAADIKSYIKDRLANFKVPRHIIITDDIPVNASGKILKRELRQKAISEKLI